MTALDLDDLNARFGNRAVRFTHGDGGMPTAEIANEQATATIALQGAHLTRFVPRGAKPVAWLSPAAKFAPGKSVRGGVPVCWPWFGPHETHKEFPAHGFARMVPWEVVASQALSGDITRLRFRLLETETTRAQWPHPSEVYLNMNIGANLEMELVTRNTGSAAFTLGTALHTYFAVGDVRHVRVHGLDGLPYIDKVDAFKRKQQHGAVQIDGEVDRIYLDSSADCVIEDPDYRRRIRIRKSGSRSTVVWNPGKDKAEQMGDLGPDGYLHMLCVESANAADDVVQVAPGAEHRLWVQYGIEAL